jgi:acetyl esterase/lipase
MKLTRSLLLPVALCLLSVVTAARADEPLVIPLWEKGAPGFESRKDEPEVVTKGGSVSNVHNPSITVFPAPKDKANGTAVIIVPGGGHKSLGFIGEGVEPARFLNDLGITCFVLKHRLAREPNSPYSLDIHPRQDIQRAMRLIRSRAAEWNLDPKRIGAMGFSAGGETVAFLAYSPFAGDPQATDPIDRVDCRCDFQISIYPGPVGIPAGPIPADAPPAFFLVANDDTSHVGAVLDQVAKYEAAKIPVECHLYAKGGHGFTMGARSKLTSIHTWTQRLADWLADSGLLVKADAAQK